MKEEEYPDISDETGFKPRTDHLHRSLFPGTFFDGARKSMTTSNREIATIAGGCFWGMEEILKQIPGVIETTVGYTGGSVPNPTYKQVCTGATGHAEAIQIVFDP